MNNDLKECSKCLYEKPIHAFPATGRICSGCKNEIARKQRNPDAPESDYDPAFWESLPSTVHAKKGIDQNLEDEADRILAADRKASGHKYTEFVPYLSFSQLQRRYNHEVYVGTGTPDESLFKGQFSRVYVPKDRPPGSAPES